MSAFCRCEATSNFEIDSPRNMHRITKSIAVLMFAFMLAACINEETETSNNPTASQATDTSQTNNSTQVGGGTNQVNLSWVSPSGRSDGSYLPVSELAGYIVHMGTTSDNMQPIIDLNDNSITNYTVRDLAAGSYYFSVTAYDTSGLVSNYSLIIHVQLS
jgi:hypothetical protein